jgi:LEA14-like dessication related protein
VNASQPGISDPVAYVNETSASWGEVTDARTPIDMQFTVYNAKTLPMAVTEIGYNVTMNGVNVGSGATDREYVIESHTTETIDAETAIRNDRLDDWWVTHLERNQVTDLRIDFYAEIEVGGQTYRVPLEELTYEETVETDIFGTKGESETSATETTTAAESDGGSSDDGATGTTEETTTDADESTTSDGETTSTNDDGSSGEGTTTDDGLLSRSAIIA